MWVTPVEIEMLKGRNARGGVGGVGGIYQQPNSFNLTSLKVLDFVPHEIIEHLCVCGLRRIGR